jgi:putative flippase GtrA
MSKNTIQFMKFCLVGVLNTGIDFSIFTLLHLAGLPYLAAQAISYTCGVFNSYFINRSWTFHSSTNSFRTEGIKFLALNLVNLLITSGLLFMLHDSLHWSVNMSKIISTTAGVLLNFIGNRLWVFDKSHQMRSESVCK